MGNLRTTDSFRLGDDRMTKGQLIEQIARNQQLSLKNAETAVNTIFRAMGDALVDGDRVEIRGFGSFEVRAYGPYRGRNPKSGEAVEVPSKKTPFFKPGKALRQRIDEGADPQDDGDDED